MDNQEKLLLKLGLTFCDDCSDSINFCWMRKSLFWFV